MTSEDSIEAVKVSLIQNILDIDDKRVLANLATLLQRERLEKLKDEHQDDKKAYSVEDVRKKHPNAYMPWSTEDDEYLEQLYCEKLTVKQLSVAFGRNQGAIRSRIAKLELAEKYGR